jgi:hypothetical protein
MSDPSGGRPTGSGSSGQGSSAWEQRAAELASEAQRWLIRSSARTMRDELGDQVKKAFRGKPTDPGEVWATATTEPPDALYDAPECAWCPICRAARRMAQAQAQAPAGGASTTAQSRDDALAGARTAASQAGPVLTGAANALVGVARDALEGLDAILSYRPGDLTATKAGNGAPEPSTPEPSQAKEAEHEPDHRS